VADALEQRLRDLGEFIRDRRRDARLSLRRLSELAGVSNPYLSQIERGLRKPSADILQQVAHALHLSAETLYERAGILDVRDGSPDVEREVMRDPSLTERQKQALLEIYRSFQAEPDGHDRATSEPTPNGPGAS
jgi:transcriptional regulator with XRE-family HTH domain